MKEIVVILDNIRSMHNVGSMFRTADGAGIKKIYLCGITPLPIDRFKKPRPQFVKVSLGAEKTIPWEYAPSILKLVMRLKKEGYKIIAVEQDKKSVIYTKARFKKSEKIAVIVGNEVRGIQRTVLKNSDTILEIPMRGKKESLNVGVAFGVILYFLARE